MHAGKQQDIITETDELPLDKIPKSENISFKPKFTARYRLLLGDRYDEFIKFSLSYINKCIRVNTLKITIPELKKRMSQNWNLKQIPWCKEGFWIEHRGEGNEKRFDIGNTIEHQLGYIYVQDGASMIPPIALEPKPGEKVLDMCASPGSKTTEIAQLMENRGVIIANEMQCSRIIPLSANMQRCGVLNSVITAMAGERFPKAGMLFDRILVDAPCSGTGTIRRNLKNIKMWSPELVKKMSLMQKSLISSAYQCLKQGGTLVYSTCTL
ncbi:MAG: NOL1/NOP2/sun family putative RNA methylase, partial [Candidatus Woesearchaeota archaeon]